jgi:cell division protein FtsX
LQQNCRENPYAAPQEATDAATAEQSKVRRSYIPTAIVGAMLGAFVTIALSPLLFRLAMSYLDAEADNRRTLVYILLASMVLPVLFTAGLLILVRRHFDK